MKTQIFLILLIVISFVASHNGVDHNEKANKDKQVVNHKDKDIKMQHKHNHNKKWKNIRAFILLKEQTSGENSNGKIVESQPA